MGGIHPPPPTESIVTAIAMPNDHHTAGHDCCVSLCAVVGLESQRGFDPRMLSLAHCVLSSVLRSLVDPGFAETTIWHHCLAYSPSVQGPARSCPSVILLRRAVDCMWQGQGEHHSQTVTRCRSFTATCALSLSSFYSCAVTLQCRCPVTPYTLQLNCVSM